MVIDHTLYLDGGLAAATSVDLVEAAVGDPVLERLRAERDR